MPRRLLYLHLRSLAIISLIWVIFGIVFFENLIRNCNDLGVRVELYQFCIAYGLIGFIITAIIIFYLKPAFSHHPVWLATLYKLLFTVVLFFIIAFVLLFLYYLILYKKTFHFGHFLDSFFTKILKTRTFTIFIVDMAIMTVMSIVILEVKDKYGPGMFWAMISGDFNKPVVQNRIFIFLDINEATSIAETLGHERYFRMLRKFFADITMPILATGGEIYQYVGDEVVVSWPNTAENKQLALKFLRYAYFVMERKATEYERRFQHVPRFKAGVHAGEVTAGFVGIIKKDLLYTGDTVNTTARIRSVCHDVGESFVLSGDFMKDFERPNGYKIKAIGRIELKGRTEPVKLYSMRFE
jgi:adenylate cyclase